MSESKTPVAVATKKNEITEQVLQKVNSLQSVGELKIPNDYSPENALKSAYLILIEQKDRDNKPVLESCSKESIANTLFDMVIQGLSPMKKQCYFIPYAGKLTLSKSYAGTMAIAKRVAKIESITANVIYKKDEFVYQTDPISGFKKLVSHQQKLENIDINEIVGAYAVIKFNDETSFIEPMTMKQIQTSWMQGPTKGTSPAHKNFPDEMCKKTAINRACKMIINSSSDSDMYNEFDSPESPDLAKEKRDEKTASKTEAAETIEFEVVEQTPETKVDEKKESKPIDPLF
jgi:recombination protein RecT